MNRGTQAIGQFLHDSRFAVRTLRKTPGFTLTAMLTLGLGIGAATILFTITYGVLLKPLPWPDSDRLVRLMETRNGSPGRVPLTVSNSTYLAWRDEHATIEDLGGWTRTNVQTVVVANEAEPARIPIGSVTPSLFAILRTHSIRGRLFGPNDVPRGPGVAGGVVVLSYGLWQERFGGRDDAIGRVIRLDGQANTVIGVTPREFAFPDRQTRAWVPLPVVPVRGEGGVLRGQIFLALARLRPGVTPAQAATEGTVRARNAPDPGLAAVALFGNNGNPEIVATPAVSLLTAEVRPAILLLLAAVGLLLAIASANVASLQLARAVTRRREMAIRAAIGAGAGALTRQLMVESGIVGLSGGALGFATALMLQRFASLVLPADFPRLDDIAIDWRVALFTIGVSLLVSITCALLPLVHATRTNLVESLADRATASGIGFRTTRARFVIIAGQIAVTCTLLVAAALLGRSFVARLNADRGYDASNLLTARLPFPQGYPVTSRIQLIETMLERLRAIPGVNVATFGNALPFVSPGGYQAFTLRPPRNPGMEIPASALRRVVSPGYFEALRLRVLAGRALTNLDSPTSPSVIVVNRSFAAKYLSDRPVGERIPVRLRSASEDAEVVGIVDDMRQGDASDPPQPELFASYRQVSAALAASEPTLLVRTAGNPLPYVEALRTILREQAPALAFDSVMTMDDRVMSSLARPRSYFVLLGGFAVSALIIAAVGLSGALAYSVTQRTKEIGIRAALGAQARDIVALLMRQAVVVVGVGIAAGLILSIVAGNLISRFLYGVSPTVGLTFTAVAWVLGVVSAAACFVPARRAGRVNPLVALRAE